MMDFAATLCVLLKNLSFSLFDQPVPMACTLPSPLPPAHVVIYREYFNLLSTSHCCTPMCLHYTFPPFPTGAEVMSLVNSDENKTFGVVLRTPVENSKGIPHILEHSVLCGSRKYPIKEPFVELMKGSLNTFLNAFTYPDRTCYPVASCNLQVR